MFSDCFLPVDLEYEEIFLNFARKSDTMKSGNYNRIKEVLEEQGRTQTWLAKKLNITFRQVNSYCSNSSQPSIPVLYDISILLQTPVSELLRESSQELLKTDDL